MLHHFQRGQPRRLLRLAIVGVAHPSLRAGAARAQHVGVHVVSRHAIRRANLLEESERLVLGFDVRQARDETALLLLDLGGRPPVYGGVGSHRESVAERRRDADALL